MRILLLLAMIAGPALAQERERHLVTYDNVAIDVIAKGRGPLIMLLPSRGRWCAASCSRPRPRKGFRRG